MNKFPIFLSILLFYLNIAFAQENVAPRTITIVIQKGNTLWGIASNYLNDPFLWKELLKYNDIDDPNLIYAGNSLKVPISSEEDAQNALKNLEDYLIKQGKIDEARREIADASTATRRDGTLLYYQALLESDGAKSYQFLEAAFKAEIAPRFLEDNVYLMALYYLAEGNFAKVASSAAAYLQHWEAGRFRTEMQRLAALAYYEQGREAESKKYLDRMMRERFGPLWFQASQAGEAPASQRSTRRRTRLRYLQMPSRPSSVQSPPSAKAKPNMR